MSVNAWQPCVVPKASAAAALVSRTAASRQLSSAEDGLCVKRADHARADDSEPMCHGVFLPWVLSFSVVPG